MLTDTGKSPFAKVSGLPSKDAAWTGGFYRERFERLSDVTVGHLQQMFESAEISHVLENFRIAAGEAQGEFAGTVFGDGDFYKWMESAVYTAEKTGRKELLERLEEYIALFARAQQEDGDLSTKQIIGERLGNGVKRQGDINDFEVYNMGHMFTSACLYYRLTGKDSFLKVAERAAGYLKGMYEEAAAKGEVKTAVCPSHYMGLIELYRTTGKREYLELAKLSVSLRDSVKNGLDDNQDRIPLKTHRKIVGHAVRANYLYAGVADLYLETGDKDCLEVLESVWRDLTTKKIYLTGGCGALYNGASPYGNFMHHQLVHQAYGYAYQLPNVTAYNETCANIGFILWAWRMFVIRPEACCMDWLEQAMLNAAFAGISLDGRRFFYENMLRRAKKLDYELIWGQERSEYIFSYCCPPNLARTIAETSEYAYAKDAEGVWTGLYGESRAHFALENGADFVLKQETDYPWDGEICFFTEKSNGRPFTLHLRVPGWVRKGTLTCDAEYAFLEGAEGAGAEETTLNRENAGAEEVTLGRENAGTYLHVRVKDPRRAKIRLKLEMEPRLVRAHGLVEENRNQAAVCRGPIVYCVEEADLPGVEPEDLLLPANVNLKTADMEICGCRIKALEGEMYREIRSGADRDDLYQDFAGAGLEAVHVRMIPYFAWDNRGKGEMMVWLPLAWR